MPNGNRCGPGRGGGDMSVARRASRRRSGVEWRGEGRRSTGLHVWSRGSTASEEITFGGPSHPSLPPAAPLSPAPDFAAAFALVHQNSCSCKLPRGSPETAPGTRGGARANSTAGEGSRALATAGPLDGRPAVLGAPAGPPRGWRDWRNLFGLVVLSHDRRLIRHIAVSPLPTVEWTAQQIRHLRDRGRGTWTTIATRCSGRASCAPWRRWRSRTRGPLHASPGRTASASGSSARCGESARIA